MIIKQHEWFSELEDNFTQETAVVNNVTKIHKLYLDEKALVLEVNKEKEIVRKIEHLESNLNFVSSVLKEIINGRLNKGSDIIEKDNLQVFSIYIQDVHLIIDNIWKDIDFLHNRLEAINLSKERMKGTKRYKTEIIVALVALGASLIVGLVTMVFEILSFYKPL